MRKTMLFLFSALCLLAVSCGEKLPKEIAVSSVSLSQSSAEMLEGETVQLKATVLPSDATDDNVTWASSKQSVATVSASGLVTAVSEGESTITASAGGQSATCRITVTKKYVAVTSVSLDKSTVTITEGQSTILVATVSPSDATDSKVAWSSSKPAVATVSDAGAVTAVSAGETVITASAGGKSAVCVVTVEKKIIDVSSVTLDRSSLTLEIGQSTTLTATVSPADATDKTVTWTSSDPFVASVDASGLVKALKKGNATVTATAGGKSASCAVTVNNIQFAISPSEVSVPGAGGSFEITVTCSGEYHLNSKPDWVTEISTSGKVHTFTVGVNPGAEERSGVIVFCDDDGTCLPCRVKQAPGGAFTITPSSVEIEAKGGLFVVKVVCSTGYHINSMPSWISDVSDPSLVQEHLFSVAANPSEDERSGVIVFCDDKGTCLPCSIKQKGKVPDSAGGGNENVPDGDPIKW